MTAWDTPLADFFVGWYLSGDPVYRIVCDELEEQQTPSVPPQEDQG